MDYLGIITVVISIITLFSAIFWMLLFLEEDKCVKGKVNYSVAILIPCIREGFSIVKTVKNASSVDYKKKKIYIVLNKGSTEETIKAAYYCKDKFGAKVIEAPFKGKSKVMNFAISHHIKEDLILVLDADTIIEKDLLKKAVPCFKDKKVAAVISSVRVLNEKDSWISWAQKYEYDLSILARNASSKINSLIIAHGAGSLFRRESLESIGLFDENNVTEDLEIGLRLNVNKYKVINVLDAYSYTEVPTTLKGLFKQRRRWYTGYIINTLSYYKRILKSRNKDLAYIFLPFSYISTFVAIFSLVLLGIGIYQAYFYWKILYQNKEVLLNLLRFSIPNFLSLSFPTILAIISAIIGIFTLFFMLYRAKGKIELEDIGGMLFYIFIYNLLISFIWIYAIFYVLLLEKQSGW